MQENTIYNEDCLETMSRMPSEYLDFVLTSPPYGSIRKYNGYSFEFEKIATELFRVLKPGGVCVWVVGETTKDGTESCIPFRQALFFRSVGFLLYDTMIYRKLNVFPLNHRRYEQIFEYMFVFSKGIPKTFCPLKDPCKLAGQINTGGCRNWKDEHKVDKAWGHGKPIKDTKVRSNIWEYNTGFCDKKKDAFAKQHPAIFPEQLAEDHLLSWTVENDLVYDPFAGSGTTGKICKEQNRRYILSEISSEYCKVIEQRLSVAKIQRKVNSLLPDEISLDDILPEEIEI